MNELDPFHSTNQDTILTMLRRSSYAAPVAESAGKCRVYNIDSPDPLWDRFLVRTRLDAHELREALKNSSMLTSPEQLFSGFMASQPILSVVDRNTGKNALEIIPKHLGVTLLSAVSESRLRAKDVFEQLSSEKHGVGAQQRMNHFFEQVAFIATQENTSGDLDIHTKNIMLHDGSLSIIDCFSPEDYREDAPHTPEAKKQAAKNAINKLHNTLSLYSEQLVGDGVLLGWYEDLQQIINEARDHSLAAIEQIDSNVEAAQALGHPEWKGFAEVDRVQLALSEQVSKLKPNIAALYEQTTGEQIGAAR